MPRNTRAKSSRTRRRASRKVSEKSIRNLRRGRTSRS